MTIWRDSSASETLEATVVANSSLVYIKTPAAGEIRKIDYSYEGENCILDRQQIEALMYRKYNMNNVDLTRC